MHQCLTECQCGDGSCMLCDDTGAVCCDLCRKRQQYADEGRCYDTETFGECDGCLVCRKDEGSDG